MLQIQKLIRKEIEELLKKYEIPYEVQKDKKGNYNLIQLFPKNLDLISLSGIRIEIYKKYLVLNISSWHFYEKLESVDNLENLKIIQILDKFFNQEMKIKMVFKKLKPIQWKIYLFKNSEWVLFKQSSSFLKKLLTLKPLKTCELSIDSFTCKNQGVTHA